MIALLLGCGPFDRWPDPTAVFPYVAEDEELEDYETARWEEGTWDPSNPERVAQYVLKAFNHRKRAPRQTLQHFQLSQVPPLADGQTVGIAGDVMYIDQDDWSTYALPSAPLLDADLRIGNLETPTSPAHSTQPRALGLYAFNAPPEMLDSLPFDVLQLNNNHSLDTEDAGLEATLEEVASRGFVQTGIDSHAVVDGVAVLAYTWGLNDSRTSDQHELYVVPFGSANPVPLESIQAGVEQARDDADHVIVMLHWGYEYEYYPDLRFMQLAREIVAMGADVVAGHGPHVVQPAELCHVETPEIVPGVGTCSVRGDRERTAAIYYSLGDFGSEVITVQARVGIVGTVSLGSEGVTGMAWEGAATTFSGGVRIEPLEDVLDPEYQAESVRLEQHLGAGWKR